MKKEEIAEIKKQQVYKLLYMPISKEEKVDNIAKILNKTDEEILEEVKEKQTFRDDIREIFKYLFEKEEGEKDENQKSK